MIDILSPFLKFFERGSGFAVNGSISCAEGKNEKKKTAIQDGKPVGRHGPRGNFVASGSGKTQTAKSA